MDGLTVRFDESDTVTLGDKTFNAASILGSPTVQDQGC
jgi:hypothetical protein